jgi:hypothetical protein
MNRIIVLGIVALGLVALAEAKGLTFQLSKEKGKL